MIVRTVNKAIGSQEFLSRLWNEVINNPRFVALVTALTKSEQRKIVMKQGKINDRGRQFVDAGTKTDLRIVVIPSEGSKQLPSDFFDDDKTKPCAYSMKQSIPRFASDWYDPRPSRAESGSKNRNPSNKESAFKAKFKYSPDVRGMIVIKPAKELFADPVDYRNYRLIKKYATTVMLQTNCTDIG